MVLQVDQERLRIFVVEQGELTDYSEVNGILQERITQLAELIAACNASQDVQFIIVTGQSKEVDNGSQSLPPMLRSHVADTFITRLTFSVDDLGRAVL